MKITEDEASNTFRILFKFDLSIEEEINQVEFLCSYYIAKLRMLRRENPELATTKELFDTETYYKDMISATASYLESLKVKKKQHDRTVKESAKLSPDLPAEGC